MPLKLCKVNNNSVPELNSATRKHHNFGANRKPIIQKEGGGKGEGRNWVANFTRGDCMGCRDVKGENCHVGRSGEPLVLIIGDEATPSAVGYTKAGEQNSCCWIFKKEHLGLNEDMGIVKRTDEEKKEWDREFTNTNTNNLFTNKCIQQK